MTKSKINCNSKAHTTCLTYTMFVNPHFIYYIFFWFYSLFVCMYAYANVCLKTICDCIRQINIHMSEVHCGSAFEPGGSGLPYYCIPPVCVLDVLCALPVWRFSKKTKSLESRHHAGGRINFGRLSCLCLMIVVNVNFS